MGVPRSPLRSSPPLPSRVNRRDGQGRGRLLPALPFPWCHPAGTPAEGSASSSPFPFPASGPGLGLPHRRVGQVLAPSPAPGLLAPHRRGLGGGPQGARGRCRGRAGFGPRCPPQPPLVSPPRSVPGPGPPAPRVLAHLGVSPGSGLCLRPKNQGNRPRKTPPPSLRPPRYGQRQELMGRDPLPDHPGRRNLRLRRCCPPAPITLCQSRH